MLCIQSNSEISIPDAYSLKYKNLETGSKIKGKVDFLREDESNLNSWVGGNFDIEKAEGK